MIEEYQEEQQADPVDQADATFVDKPIAEVPALNPGDRFVATVRFARKEGVAVSLPMGGNGTVSPRCWGSGPERMEALGKISSGDSLEVVVRSWDPRTKTASLVLPGFEDLPRIVKPKLDNGLRHAPKAAFRPEPQGTTFVFDLANVIAQIPPACIPNAKSAIEARFSAAGYPTLFYLDNSAVGWLYHVLPDGAARDEFFKNFRDGGNASYIGGREKATAKVGKREADLAVVQTVAAIEGAVACSRDGFGDYEQAFPGVVPERIRRFSVIKRPDQSAVLAVEGAGCAAVIIPPFRGEPSNDGAISDTPAA